MQVEGQGIGTQFFDLFGKCNFTAVNIHVKLLFQRIGDLDGGHTSKDLTAGAGFGADLSALMASAPGAK